MQMMGQKLFSASPGEGLGLANNACTALANVETIHDFVYSYFVF